MTDTSTNDQLNINRARLLQSFPDLDAQEASWWLSRTSNSYTKAASRIAAIQALHKASNAYPDHPSEQAKADNDDFETYMRDRFVAGVRAISDAELPIDAILAIRRDLIINIGAEARYDFKLGLQRYWSRYPVGWEIPGSTYEGTEEVLGSARAEDIGDVVFEERRKCWVERFVKVTGCEREVANAEGLRSWYNPLTLEADAEEYMAKQRKGSGGDGTAELDAVSPPVIRVVPPQSEGHSAQDFGAQSHDHAGPEDRE